MGRKRLKRQRPVRAVGPLPDRSDLPPDVAEFMRIFDEAGLGFVVGSSGDGRLWTIWDADGNPAMEFTSGPAPSTADVVGPVGRDAACMDLAAL